MNDSMVLFGNFIIGVVVMLLIFGIIKAFINNQPIMIDQLSKSDGFVLKTFKELAMSMVASEFHKIGKPTHTQKGAYRADYLKAVNKKQNDLINACCSNDCFSDDFCAYVNATYPLPVRKDLYTIIDKYFRHRNQTITKNFNNFINSNSAITPKEFFAIKSRQSGDVVGAYIIYNKTKDMYYIGQAKRLFFRVNQHFTGHGNGDVYADYKYGDDFTIQIIKLSDSGYSDLDKLEKDLIEKYDAFNLGYNRTSGNK